MRTCFVCVTLAALSMPPLVRAQQLPLTEREAVARFSADSPRVQAIRASIDLARADVLSAARWPNPRLTWDRESVAGVSENMFMVTQPLPVTGRRRLEIGAASALVDASVSRADEEVRRARADLRIAYADLQSAQAREREYARARDRLRDLTDVLARRESAGEGAGFDRLRADREVLDLETSRTLAAVDRHRAQMALVAFFANPVDPPAVVAEDIALENVEVPPVDVLMRQAEMTRGEIAAWRFEVESARLAEYAAGRRRLPEPEIVLGTKSSTVGGGDVGSVLTLHATLPLFDRGGPERAAARGRASLADARAQAFRQTLRAQIIGLREVVLERRRIAAAYREAASSSADTIERIAQVSYDAGERGILELLDAYRSGATARVRQAELDATVRQAEIELEYVSGWETP